MEAQGLETLGANLFLFELAFQFFLNNFQLIFIDCVLFDSAVLVVLQIVSLKHVLVVLIIVVLNYNSLVFYILVVYCVVFLIVQIYV